MIMEKVDRRHYVGIICDYWTHIYILFWYTFRVRHGTHCFLCMEDLARIVEANCGSPSSCDRMGPHWWIDRHAHGLDECAGPHCPVGQGTMVDFLLDPPRIAADRLDRLPGDAQRTGFRLSLNCLEEEYGFSVWRAGP